MEWQKTLERCRLIKEHFDRSYKCLNIDRPISKETLDKHLVIIKNCLEKIRALLNVHYERLNTTQKTAAEAFFCDLRRRTLALAEKRNIDIKISETIHESIISFRPQEFQETTNMASFNLESVAKTLTLFSGNHVELESFIITAELINKTLSETSKADFLQYVYHAKLTSNVRTALGNVNPITSFETLKSLLKNRYKCRKTIPELQNKLLQLSQRNMTVNTYRERLTEIIDNLNKIGIEELGETASEAEKKIIIKTNNKLALDSFKRGINENLKPTLYAARPTTLEDAVELAQELENEQKLNNSTVMHFRNQNNNSSTNRNNNYNNRNNEDPRQNYNNNRYNSNNRNYNNRNTISNNNNNNYNRRNNNYNNNDNNYYNRRNNNYNNNNNNNYNKRNNNFYNDNNNYNRRNSYRNRNVYTMTSQGNESGSEHEDVPDSQN